MATPISHDLVRDYFEACTSRDPARIAAFLDDDVTWSVTGPIDVLPFCGQWRGKGPVVDTIARHCPSVLRVTTMEIEETIIEGDRAATFMRVSAVHNETGRTVSYRAAQFLRFHHGKLIEFRALIDSFDAAEQMVGHPIEVVPPQPARANVHPL